ncbi:MAG TPA: hypothetical protein VKQ32_20305 [Polyangia bacterium]|nr:hypothetical protein [Polyangia bacterium]
MTRGADGLIRLPPIDSKAVYLNAFWRWVERLAADDYQGAIDGLHWPKGTSWTAASLRDRVTTFFGGAERWVVVVPNDRLVRQINDQASHAPRNKDGWAWFMAQIPLTTKPADPKNDAIPLMGLATSFFVTRLQAHNVLEFEIFHA